MKRELTDFGFIFTFVSLWVKWEKQQITTGWCSGGKKERDNTKQRHSGVSDILKQTHTHTRMHTHTQYTHVCALGV